MHREAFWLGENKSLRRSISPAIAFPLLNNGAENCILVDVRSAVGFNGLHAHPAIHIPLEQIATPESIDRLMNKKFLFICHSGTRGRKAVEALFDQGLTDVVNVEGGTTAWNDANLPVVEGKRSISIDRQVRMSAGMLIALGCLAGLTLSPYFFVIPLFVGAGLLFSGITDTCGMALVLARCPWNSK